MLYRELESKLSSITILRTISYGEIIWGVNKVYYKSSKNDVNLRSLDPSYDQANSQFPITISPQ